MVIDLCCWYCCVGIRVKVWGTFALCKGLGLGFKYFCVVIRVGGTVELGLWIGYGLRFGLGYFCVGRGMYGIVKLG